MHLLNFDVSTLVRTYLLLQRLGNEGLEDEVLPLASATLGMNRLVALHSLGVYGNIIHSSVYIP